MTTVPAVSVIIPTRDRATLLERALRALAAQTAPAGTFEVCVAVNGSVDGTQAMLDRLRTPYELRVVHVPSPGRAGACNAAIAQARGAVLIILDDDMRPAPAFVERHLQHHAGDVRCCVMGAVPVLVDDQDTGAARWVAARFAEHLQRLAQPGHAFTTRDFFSGNASVRADVLREAGGFDDAFGAYGNEDVELALRLRAAGVELAFDPDALAWQSYDKDLAGLAQDTTAKGGTTVQLARKHPEVFATLRLADPGDAGRPWLAARSVLLALTRRRSSILARLVDVAGSVERAGLWPDRLGYRALTDYAFWAGVQRTLGPAEPDPRLAWLREQLHRGPVSQLLRGQKPIPVAVLAAPAPAPGVTVR